MDSKITFESAPIKFIGVSFGVNTLFRFIGSAIGPAIQGMFMLINQTFVHNGHN